MVTIKVRARPDALVKIYDETNDTIIYIDTTDANGETAPINLPQDNTYYIDISVYH